MFRDMPGHELERRVKSSRAKHEGNIYAGGLLCDGAAERSDPDGDFDSAPKIDDRRACP
jgi:hypothetical protein